LTVIEGVQVLDIEGRRFWVLPFITYEKAYMRVLKAIVEHPEFRPNEDSLLTHIGIRSATMNTCFLLKDWSIIDFEEFPFHRVYTGHFHSKQQIGENVWYPGSPIPFKFDEGDVPHGFYVLDLEADSHKFINIWKAGAKFFPDEVPPPQFITLLDELLDEKGEGDVKDCMVRVALQREHTADEKNSIKSRLLGLGARDVRWMDLKTKDSEDPDEVVESGSVGLHQDLFAAWLEKDEKGLKDLDSKVLSRCNEEVTHEGDELYAIEATEI
jgi:DNA repair exonuclease SbcCD nuclease subunit